MSTESYNRTDVEELRRIELKDGFKVIDFASHSKPKNPNVNLDVLEQKIVIHKRKKICINNLNKRLHLAKKKDKYKKFVIISSIFVSVGLFGFIAG